MWTRLKLWIHKLGSKWYWFVVVFAYKLGEDAALGWINDQWGIAWKYLSAIPPITSYAVIPFVIIIILIMAYRESLRDASRVVNYQDSLSDPFEITIPEIEANFSTAPTPLNELFNDHLVRSGIKKYRRYYKIALKNKSKSKTARNVRVDSVHIEALEIDSNTTPLHLQSKTLLQDLEAHFPLVLCFTKARKAPHLDHIDLNPEEQATVDVIRWEYDGQDQPTFFLCHTKEGLSGEIPLGTYRLTVKITSDDIPAQEKQVVIGKQGQQFKVWFQDATVHV